MQVDVQAAMPSMKVIVARPILFDLGVIARILFPSDESVLVGKNIFSEFLAQFNQTPQEETTKLLDEYMPGFATKVNLLTNVTLPGINQFIDVIQQASSLEWRNIVTLTYDGHLVDVAKLRHLDRLDTDSRHGICPIPLYEFGEREWGILIGGAHVDDVKTVLKELGIYQFFFPAPDQLALGLVERGIQWPWQPIERG